MHNPSLDNGEQGLTKQHKSRMVAMITVSFTFTWQSFQLNKYQGGRIQNHLGELLLHELVEGSKFQEGVREGTVTIFLTTGMPLLRIAIPAWLFSTYSTLSPSYSCLLTHLPSRQFCGLSISPEPLPNSLASLRNHFPFNVFSPLNLYSSFLDGVLLCCTAGLKHNPPASISPVGGVTDVYHQVWLPLDFLTCWLWSLQTDNSLCLKCSLCPLNLTPPSGMKLNVIRRGLLPTSPAILQYSFLYDTVTSVIIVCPPNTQ